MSETVIVGLLSLLGTLVGTLGGIYVSQKLTNYRLDKLEENVEDIKKLTDRVITVESDVRLLTNRVEDLENEDKRFIADIRELQRRQHNATNQSEFR